MCFAVHNLAFDSDPEDLEIVLDNAEVNPVAINGTIANGRVCGVESSGAIDEKKQGISEPETLKTALDNAEDNPGATNGKIANGRVCGVESSGASDEQKQGNVTSTYPFVCTRFDT